MNNLFKAIIQQGIINETGTFYFDTEGIGGELKPLDPFYTFMAGYNTIDGYHYFVMQEHGGIPNNRANHVYKFDINSMSIIQDYIIPVDAGITETYDTHPKGVIDFDSNGHIYILQERGDDSVDTASGHDTDWLLYKTTTPGDITTLTLLKTIVGYWSYPILQVNSLSSIFLGGRGRSVGVTLDRWTIQVSNDAGANFNEYEVIDTGLGGEARAYVQRVANYYNNDIILALNPRRDSEGAFFAVYIIRSSDGITWTNWQQTFSKNVNSSGAISMAELDANCLIVEQEDTDHVYDFDGGVFRGNELKLLITRASKEAVLPSGFAYETPIEFRIYTYSSGWNYTALPEITPNYRHIWARERCWSLSSDGSTDYIYVIDNNDTNYPFYEYKSNNNFLTYSIRKLTNFDNKIYYGSHIFNCPSLDKRLLILIDVQGDFTDLDADSNLILIKP